MKREKFSYRKLLVSLNTQQSAPSTVAPIRYALVQGRRVVDSGEIDKLDPNWPIAEHIKACFHSNQAYAERLSLNAINRKILPLRIKRHLDNESLFNEEYVYRNRVLTAVGRDFECEVFAVANHDKEEAFRSLPAERIPVSYLGTAEASISALLRRVIDQPTIVLFVRSEILIAMLVDGNGVISKRMEHIDGINFMQNETSADAGSNLVENNALLLDQCRMIRNAVQTSAVQRIGKDVHNTLLLGDLTRLEDPALGEDFMVDLDCLDRLQGLFTGLDSANVKEILLYPELYGLAFTENAQSFTDSSYSDKVARYLVAKPALIASISLSLILSLVTAASYWQRNAIMTEARANAASLQTQIAELQKNLPPAEAVKKTSRLVELNAQRLKQLSLNSYFTWLTRQIPDGIYLTAVKLSPSMVQNRTGRGKPRVKPGYYDSSLTLEARGSFKSTQALAKKLIKHLSQHCKIEDSSFNYLPTSKSRGVATVEILTSVEAAKFI